MYQSQGNFLVRLCFVLNVNLYKYIMLNALIIAKCHNILMEPFLSKSSKCWGKRWAYLEFFEKRKPIPGMGPGDILYFDLIIDYQQKW